MSETKAGAMSRVERFLDIRRDTFARGIDPELIHSIHTGTDLAADLKVSDLRELIGSTKDLLAALKDLYAVVCGECPSLLNEDSGGSAELDDQIRSAIAKAEGRA